MEAPDELLKPAGTPFADDDGREESQDETIEDDDGDSYRRECERVLDEDSDTGEPEQESAMELEGSEKEVITDPTISGAYAITNSSKGKMGRNVKGETCQGPKEKVTKKPPPLPTVPGSEMSSATERGTKDEIGFPQQYFTIKANRARSENQVALGGIGEFSRVGGGGGVCRTAGSTLSLIQGNSL
jgi:hypothetical protein